MHQRGELFGGFNLTTLNPGAKKRILTKSMNSVSQRESCKRRFLDRWLSLTLVHLLQVENSNV